MPIKRRVFVGILTGLFLVRYFNGFGAFVDIGVRQDGLFHGSELSDGYVKNPADVVKVRQSVMATVLDVDVKRRRIASP